MESYNKQYHPSVNSVAATADKPFFQPKLTINNPNDKYEQEADAVADKVMQMETPSVQKKSGADSFFSSSPISITPLQRKCDNCKEEEKMQRKEIDGEELTADNNLENYVGGLQSGGHPLPNEARNFYEPRFGYDFSNVKIHTDAVAAKSAQSINAMAYTSGSNIVFNSNQYSPNTDSGKRLLGHELTHVVQQRSKNSVNLQRKCESPHDKAVLESAKKRLKILEPQLNLLNDKKISTGAEELRVLADRRSLDDHGDDPLVKEKREAEERNLKNLNRKPITLTVTDSDIVFKVNFQVFFQDPASKKNFTTLKSTIKSGIDLVWNQKLKGGVFDNRKFTIVPEVLLIDALSNRLPEFWLIEIRKTDIEKVSHPGCKMPQPGSGAPTSVTEALCDNGVMSIPPSHITIPGIIGHEMLHLFGLIDRYVEFVEIDKKTKKRQVTLDPLRKTNGRKDPLGGQDGTILSEDLGYIFSEFGVYAEEQNKNNLKLSIVEMEVRRLKEIVAYGCDPNSLIKIRKDFNDKIIKSAEDLD